MGVCRSINYYNRSQAVFFNHCSGMSALLVDLSPITHHEVLFFRPEETMNANLHPIFQEALNHFAPLLNKDGSAASPAMAALFNTTYAPAGKKQRKPTQTFQYRLCGVDLECEVEFEKGEPRTWDDPGEPDDAVLYTAMCGDQDISELLSDEQREEIETAFLNQEPEEA